AWTLIFEAFSGSYAFLSSFSAGQWQLTEGISTDGTSTSVRFCAPGLPESEIPGVCWQASATRSTGIAGHQGWDDPGWFRHRVRRNVWPSAGGGVRPFQPETGNDTIEETFVAKPQPKFVVRPETTTRCHGLQIYGKILVCR